MSGIRTAWDYTECAAHYENRPDYAGEAIDVLIATARPDRSRPVADVGAGTGKLTRALLDRGYAVEAVEPNDAMRAEGIRTTEGRRVAWRVGTGEETGLAEGSFDLVVYGSSFNVVDRPRALRETARILRPGGWFACLWNHRDLEDPVQRRVEAAIRGRVSDYAYGVRREDQTGVIRETGLFEEPVRFEARMTRTLPVEKYLDAWRSHATLARQSGTAFGEVVEEIRRAVGGTETITVPYVTRVWAARRPT